LNVTTAGAATTVTLAEVTSGAPEDGAVGALWKATLNGQLASTETIKLSSTSSTVTFKDHTGTALTVANTLTNSAFVNGVAYFTVQNSVAETSTITATGGGLLSSSVTGTGTVAFTATDDGSYVASISSTSTSLASGDTAAGASTATTTYYKARTSSASQSLRITGTAENVEYATVTDTSGKATGKTNAKYDKVFTLAATLGTATFSVPATLLVGESVNVVLTGSTSTTGNTNITITGRASAASTLTASNATRRSAVAGTNSFTATLKDQYGAAMANETVTVAVTGRNTTTTSASYTTNASGHLT